MRRRSMSSSADCAIYWMQSEGSQHWPSVRRNEATEPSAVNKSEPKAGWRKTASACSRFPPGGSPERPLDAASAAVIESHALSVRCPRCGANHELIEHSAHVRQGVRLRETKLRCRQCGSERSLWFKIVGPSLN